MNDFFQLADFLSRTLEIETGGETFLALIGLSFARIISFLFVVPFFGGALVPNRVKIAVGVALVIVVYPALAGATNNNLAPFASIQFVALLMKEAFVGLTLGFVAALVFEAARTAGRIVDLQRGAHAPELYAPDLESQISELGQFKLQFAVVIFLAMGAHHWFLSGLLESFVLLPATEFPRIESGWSPALNFFTNLSGMFLTIALQLAIPAVLTLILTDIFFGIINRVAPQINVFFLSLPIKMIVALVIVAFSLPFFQERLVFYFAEAYKAFEFTIRYLVAPHS
jgi:flagellar biosynthesis protein FliR